MRSAALHDLLLVGAHQSNQLNDVHGQQENNRRELDALSARVAALTQAAQRRPDQAKTAVPLGEPISPVPDREFSALLADARRAYPHVRHPARLLPSALHVQAIGRHQELKTAVCQSRVLNRTEVVVSGFAGLLSAIVSAVCVDVPKHPGWLGGKPEAGGPLSNWVKEQINAAVPDAARRNWERASWVPYDASHSGGLRNPVTGLSPNSHRFQSLGHDPLVGLIIGVRDLMLGQFTAIDKMGKVVINQIGPGVGFWEALLTFVVHLASDVTTARGLPVPLMPLLQFIQKGSFGAQGYTVADVSRQMYRSGYDLRHGVAMALPVLLTEVLVRTFYLFEQLRAGKTLKEALPLNQPKLRRMLLIAHGVAAAGNAGKVILTRNPLAINAPQWVALADYAIPEATWQLWGKNQAVQRLIDEDFEVFDALYNQHQAPQGTFRL